MSIYEFSVLRLVFFSTFLGLVYFTLSFFGFFFEFLEISDFLDLVLLRSVVFGRFLEISVHLRISCLEVIVVFDFLVFSIFLLSLLMFFFEFLEISDYFFFGVSSLEISGFSIFLILVSLLTYLRLVFFRSSLQCLFLTFLRWTFFLTFLI